MEGAFRALVPGDTLHLRLQTTASLTWMSDAPSVATVSSTGIVTAHSVGLAGITARMASGYSAFTFLSVYPVLCTTASTMGTIGADTSVAGVLGPGSCGLAQPDAGFDHGTAEGWRLELATAQTIRIDLEHAWRCSHLRVTTIAMALVEARGNGCVGSVQTLTRAFQPGVYLIWVATTNTAGDGGYAAYTLTLTPVMP